MTILLKERKTKALMVSRKTILKASKHLFKSLAITTKRKKDKGKPFDFAQGKVRDIYKIGNNRLLITTDRISAFDRVLGFIPYKGQVLNQLSQFWFDKSRKIVTNHLIKVLSPNVMLVKEAEPIPVEMVVRGFISGVTSTSLWQNYKSGKRIIYGQKFPEGLRKNQKLTNPLITPTTKAEKGKHDLQLSETEILKKGLVDKKIWQKMVKTSLALFKMGTDRCSKKGIILVDTKYEFGLINGRLVLIDEIHTPDSSRFWKKESYQKKFKKGEEPENFDKEFFRKWYVKKGYMGDGQPPEMSQDLMIKTSQRYISIYEKITGQKFKPQNYPLEESIRKVLDPYLKKVS